MGHDDEGFAEVDGGRLFFRATGQGHPVVLIHGGLVDSASWDGQVEDLTRRFHVLRYDVRGYGRSRGNGSSFSNVADLRALLLDRRLGRAHLVGLSMGGAIALDFALAHPEAVSALVLVGSALGGHDFSHEVSELGERMEEVYEHDPSEAVELSLRFWTDGPRRLPGEVDPGVRERIQDMTTAVFEAEDPGEELASEEPAVARLGDVSVPTLVIVGGEDVADIKRVAMLLAEGIPQARSLEIAGGAHHVNMERPHEFNREVIAFLTDVGAEAEGAPT